MQTAGEILRTYGRENTMNKRDTTGPIDQDVEGHRIYASSDRTIKDEVEPVAWEGDEEDEDVEGHRFSSSDRTIKDHVEPVVWDAPEGDDDVEGHRIYSSSDRTIKDHVEPVAWEDPQGDNDTERRN